MRSKPASESSSETGDAPDPVAEVRDAAAGPGPGPGKSDKADKPEKTGKADRSAKTTPENNRSDRPRPSTGAIAVELEVSRRRSAAWTIFGLVVGGLLIWKLGTVGVWGGVALVATGLYHAWNLIQTFLYPPGTITISDREVSLPRGLCMPRPVVAKPQDVTAVYFLRRSVPWNHAAPVLIIELGEEAMAFPRDWFASEADQRHIVHALLRDKASAATGASA
jgi:hypothetical protein